MINQVQSVQIFVSDMERAVGFYRDVLGLPVRFTNPFLTEFELDGFTFGLQYMAKEYMSTGVGVTIDFRVDEIEQKVEQLQRHGTEFVAIVLDQPYGKLAKFRDPDGNLLGLFEQTE